MEKLLKWLKKIESLASVVYLKASNYFSYDEEFAKFLRRLSAEEHEHGQLMDRIHEKLTHIKLNKLSVTLDTDVTYKIERDFSEINRMISENEITKECMLEKMIDLEFSEWNDFFLYTISTFKESFKQFVGEIEKFQIHRKLIEHYCEQYPDLIKKINELKERPPIWDEKILIVEDEEVISGLLQMVLHDQGEIDIAFNGEEGIKKVKNKYYKLIISDIDMPVMDGLTFFQTASKMFPNISQRFLFFTGDLTDDKRSFLKNNQLPYMLKPASLNEIKKNAVEILTRY